MDTLEPVPSPALLSAQEAKDRLREIVEGFFFRQRNDQGQPPARHLLVKSPPGLGKTKEAMEWATRYQTEQESKDSITDADVVELVTALARQLPDKAIGGGEPIQRASESRSF